MRSVAISSLLLLAASFSSACLFKRSGEEESVWSYSGRTGPALWHTLDPAGRYLACGSGKNQSPINIDMYNERGVTKLAKGNVVLKYPETGDFKVVNIGHTIQGEPKTAGGKVKRDGHEDYLLEWSAQKFKLINFHFHTPSEHRIDDRSFPLELHLVHTNLESGATAVLAIMFDLAYGGDDVDGFMGTLVPFPKKGVGLQGVWNLDKKEKSFDANGIKFTRIMGDVANSEVYHYEGSLTMPPCTEGVQWFVVKQPKLMTVQEYYAFRNNMKFNSRYTQNEPGAPNLGAAQCAWSKASPALRRS